MGTETAWLLLCTAKPGLTIRGMDLVVLPILSGCVVESERERESRGRRDVYIGWRGRQAVAGPQPGFYGNVGPVCGGK